MAIFDKLIQDMAGAFDKADAKQQEAIKVAVSYFHFRDGRKYDDGSMGTIHISPKQLRDLLAFWPQSSEESSNG
jgi:hypothetical protein